LPTLPNRVTKYLTGIKKPVLITSHPLFLWVKLKRVKKMKDYKNSTVKSSLTAGDYIAAVALVLIIISIIFLASI
jgi:hypothetical protein